MLGIVRERFKAYAYPDRPSFRRAPSTASAHYHSSSSAARRFGGIAAIAAALSRHQVSVGTRNLLAIQRLIL